MNPRYDIRRQDNGSWVAYHRGALFALSGTYCHLLHVTRQETTREL